MVSLISDKLRIIIVKLSLTPFYSGKMPKNKSLTSGIHVKKKGKVKKHFLIILLKISFNFKIMILIQFFY